MRKIWRKALAYMLAATMCFSAVNVPVYAQESTITEVSTETERTNKIVTEETMDGNDSNTWDQITTENVFEGENYRVTFTLTSNWDAGYNANVKLENTGDRTIQNWYLGFDYNNSITHIWNAEISLSEDKEYIIKNVGWNQDIAAGNSIEFGISGDHAFRGFPENYELIGTSAEVTGDDYTIQYKVDNDWGTGFYGSISVTSNTDTVLEDWVLEFDFDREITEIWNGVIEEQEGNHYVVRNARYNANIEAGQTVKFGFMGCDGERTEEPQNFVLSSFSALESGEDVEIDVDYTKDSDADGIPDYVEEMLGSDPLKEDTDGDGLSDFVELYDTETDILKVDTDDNGIADGDEDLDLDGLINLEEIEVGTDVSNSDSDGDGLMDSDEIEFYATSPTNSDTDADGIKDGDEIYLGLDPLNAVSDGITPDAERTFEQILSDLNIEKSLLSDNLAVPSISGNVPDNINNHVELEKENVYALEDNRAKVGKEVNITSDYATDIALELHFDCAAGINTRLLVVCKYDDGEFIPVDTKCDETSVWATVTSGVYFVLDIETFLGGLDIPIEKYKSMVYSTAMMSLSLDDEEDAVSVESDSNEVDEEWFAENYVLVNKDGIPVDESEADAEGNYYMLASALYKPMMLADLDSKDTVAEIASMSVSGQADIVFVIDSTGSMYGAINNVVKNIETFVDTLANEYSIKANFALIDYKDITCNENTILVKNGKSNWFNDVKDLKSEIASIRVSGGGDGPETAIDGLAMAESLDFRTTANKFVILVTDANYKTNNNYGVVSMAEMTEILKDAGIVTSVISSTRYQSLYNDLYTDTDGVFGNIYGDFSSVLLSLANKIGEVVNDGSWVILKDYQYVKLDRPLADDGYSTDGDSLSDAEELGEAVEKDLTWFINRLLAVYGVPEELYKDKTSITVYNYTSNPVLSDTDFDGINDDIDIDKNNNNFKGKMHYMENKEMKTCNVEFDVDYREFFTDNESYKDDIAILASLYASDIYVDNYIEVTDGATGGADDAISFGKLFGLEDVENIFINGSDYISDQDDVTDFVIGHRMVEYKDEEREIIILSIRGTNGTNAEWSSNFDVGADTEEYYAALGTEHPYWKNKEHHKGFDVTANRVLEKVESYFNRHGLNYGSVEKSILITGHSRGAAIANLVGAHYEDDAEFLSYTYTFAAPYTTTNANATSYMTIHNVMNTDDLIPHLPLEKWGFYKYGVMHTISVEDSYEDRWGSAGKGTFEWLTGHDYNNDGGTSRTLDAFYAIATNRADLYVFDSSDDGKINIGNKYHTTTKGANERYEEVKGILEDVKLLRFCDVYVVSGVTKHVEVNYCPAYLMQNLANMASETGPKTGYDTKGAYAEAKASFIASSGFIPGGFIGGMTHPHMQPTYYLIAHNKVKEL